MKALLSEKLIELSPFIIFLWKALTNNLTPESSNKKNRRRRRRKHTQEE